MYIYYNSILHILSRKESIMNVKAILLDTQSIQKYIFSGTKLKTNIGASYIVDRVFEDVLVNDILESALMKDLGIQSVNSYGWETTNGPESVDEVVKANALHADCYVAYKRIVKEFTSTLLCQYPGLKVGAAIGEIQLDEVNFSTSISELYHQLQQNKQCIHPIVNVPMTGHTLPCAINGESANAIDRENEHSKGESRYVSHEVLAKNTMSKVANTALAERFL